MSEIPGERRALSKAEVKAALDAFDAGDWAKAEVIARARCAGLTGWTHEDLLNEALVGLLGGTRVWPEGVHPLVVLANVMRSIASNEREHTQASPVDATVEVDTLGEGSAAGLARTSVTPERQLSGKEQLVAVYASVAGDQELELLVMVWADGLRGEEARETLGWDSKTYDAARNRLLRRLKKVDPERRPA